MSRSLNNANADVGGDDLPMPLSPGNKPGFGRSVIPGFRLQIWSGYLLAMVLL